MARYKTHLRMPESSRTAVPLCGRGTGRVSLDKTEVTCMFCKRMIRYAEQPINHPSVKGTYVTALP